MLEVLATAIRQEQEIKCIRIKKEEVKLSFFADDMILYVEIPKDSTKKLIDLINDFSKVAGYRINVQNQLCYLYISNEESERKTKKKSHLPLYKKKFLRINLTKDVKNLLNFLDGSCWLSQSQCP